MSRQHASTELLNVEELALRLRVKESWVYRHADDLGVLRLGKYLRFQWPTVLERLDAGGLTGSTQAGRKATDNKGLLPDPDRDWKTSRT